MNDEWWPTLLRFPIDPPVIHAISTPPVWALNIIFSFSALGWMTAFLMCARRAHIEKVIGAPYISVGTNVTWDFVYAFIFYIQPVQNVIDVIYFIIEMILLVQVFRYGYKDVSTLSRTGFNWMIVGLLTFGLAFNTAAGWDFSDQGGYSGFATTTLTSLAFLLMFNQRKSTAGQTMYIAITKMVGTLLASTGFAMLHPTRMLMWVFYITMAILDTLYVVLLYRQFKKEGVSPWRKV